MPHVYLIDLIKNDLQNTHNNDNQDKGKSSKQSSNKSGEADTVVTVAQNIIPFPPPYQLVPCKPVCVDVASSFVQFRNSELAICKDETATNTKNVVDSVRSANKMDDVVAK